ncbi:NAD-dependent protein deacetylase sirtuin-2-like [Oscarella lobularis]|uniref:NAD-dependent protein deacetylase sirtuin-2-like n=1 Tax=Oscarella lobularis TaxID=121494 RepID=UPI003313BE2F
MAEERKTTDKDDAAAAASNPTSATSDNVADFDLMNWLAGQLSQLKTSEKEPSQPVEQLLTSVSFEGIVQYIKEKKCKNVIVMTGAGISTAAGIPDFRSPGTGLYDNLQKFNLPHPQAVFEIDYFKENPQPFFTLAKELYPSNFKPTKSHYFSRLLHDKGLLLRHYTQNIDMLERIAGLPEHCLVEAHGSFNTSHCVEAGCRKEYSHEWIKEEIFADKVPTCTSCNGLVKPDVVFFGEPLPSRFHELVQYDFPKCDLLIVMGTSLAVQPFASLVGRVPPTTPRLLINREKAGQTDPMMALLGLGSQLNFDGENNYRDVFWEGNCDDGCLALAESLGWKEELVSLWESEHAKIEAKLSETKKKGDSVEKKDEEPQEKKEEEKVSGKET